MSQINLPQIVSNWVRNQEDPLGKPMYPALKVKLTNVRWQVGRKGHSKAAARQFEMRNESPTSGTGHLQTVRDGRPVTTIKVGSGVIRGFPKLTDLEMPRDIQPVVGQIARIELGQTETHRVETSMLKVDADVRLDSEELKYATVQNTDLDYTNHFTATAKLSGSVLFENSGEISINQIFSDMGHSCTWDVVGNLRVNFEDKQTLTLER